MFCLKLFAAECWSLFTISHSPIIAAAHNFEKTEPSKELLIAGLLLVGLVLTPIIRKVFHLQKLSQIRKRFSEDLQEEIETNLRTIGLLSDLAAEPHNTAEEKVAYMRRIQMLTAHSSRAMRHLADLNNSKVAFGNLRNEIERTTERILSQTRHSLSFQGETYLNKLPALAQMGLYLFLKEHLTNTIRQASPSQILISVTSNAKETTLTISEEGLLDIPLTEISHSLQHRARLIGAKVTIQKEAKDEASLILKLPTNKWGVF